MYRCTIIGISDSHDLWFAPQVSAAISKGKMFSGGKRHHDIVRSYLPEGAEWIDITVPLDDVFKEYERHDDIVVFASGDPLFYGFANTVQRKCPDVELTVYPSFNSLQMLVHRLNMPYHDMRAVSLTGRPWAKFDEALIRGEELIGCLTDKNKTPQAINERMLDYGYDNYTMFVGENLGNEEKERVGIYNASAEYANPNCILLQRKSPMPTRHGIPDNEFHLLDGRAKMITKMPVRLCTLAVMELGNRQSFWDIGFCTGSVSIEAKLMFPHLNVTAFEIRQEGKNLMQQNSRKFHVPGIHAIIGDFCSLDIADLPRPDCVFIGGYGGRMKEMLEKVRTILQPGGCIVFNSVSEESRNTFIEVTSALSTTAEVVYTIKVDDNNPITIIKAYD